MLGPSGVRVLEFYIAHSAAINGLVVLYAILLLVARLNLRRIEERAVRQVQRQLDAAGYTGDRRARAHPPAADLAWPEIVAQGSRFPLVVGAKGWYPRLATPDNVARLLPVQALVERALAARRAAAAATDPEDKTG